MRLTRCHVSAPLSIGARVVLPDGAAIHLTRVLRLREGEGCILFNGDGCDYAGTLVSTGKRESVVEISSATQLSNESPLRITLVQGVARGEKMDLILQKATELGVAAFVPVMAERTEVKLDADRASKRMAHWSSVISAACEQSGRARVPGISTVAPLAVALPVLDRASLLLTLDPNGESGIGLMTHPADGRATIAIGPEGGWSPRDREQLRAAGFQGLRLGPRVLRTETAGLAAIAALQARFGDLSGGPSD